METLPTDITISFTGEDMDSLDFPSSVGLEADTAGSVGSAVILGTPNLYTNVSHVQDQIFPSVTMDLQGLTNPFGQIGEIFDTLLSANIVRQDNQLVDHQTFGLQPTTLGSPFLFAPNGSIINPNFQQTAASFTQSMSAINIPILQGQGLKQVHVPGLPNPVVIREVDKLLADPTQLCAPAVDMGMNLLAASLPSQQANVTTLTIPQGQLGAFQTVLQEIPQRVDNQQQTDFIDDLEEEGEQEIASNLQNDQGNGFPKDSVPYENSVETVHLQHLTTNSSSLPPLEPRPGHHPTAVPNAPVNETVPFLTPSIVDVINAKLSEIVKDLRSGEFTGGDGQLLSRPTVQIIIQNDHPSGKILNQEWQGIVSCEDTKPDIDETLDVSKFLQNPNKISQPYNLHTNLSSSSTEGPETVLSGFKSDTIQVTNKGVSGLSGITVAVNSQNTAVLQLTLNTSKQSVDSQTSGTEIRDEIKVEGDLVNEIKQNNNEVMRNDVGQVPGDGENVKVQKVDDNIDKPEDNFNLDDELDEDHSDENSAFDSVNADSDESIDAYSRTVADQDGNGNNTHNDDVGETPVLDLGSANVVREIRELPSGVGLKKIAKNKPNAPDRTRINVNVDESFCVVENGMKRWKCSLCTKSYTTKHNLVTHVLDHSGVKPHCCMICGKFFKQVSHLNTHKLTHGNLKPHACNVCGKAFTQVSHMKRHLATHMAEKPHICDICSRGFAYPSELKLHKKKHARQYNGTCEECGKSFPSMKRLLLHVSASHKERSDTTCKYCNKKFVYPSQMKDHEVKHTGKRPYICGECGMDFMKEHHLRSHQFTHTGLRPHVCPVCRRAFNQRANMLRHMLIHNPQKKFECEVCKKTFSQPQTLKAHMVTHAEQKPYQCTICGKTFGRLHNLQGHMHMHEENKPFTCFCGSSFTLRGNYNRHKKVKHGMKDTDECNDAEEAAQILNQMAQKKYTEDNDMEEELDAEADVSGEQEKTDGADEMNTSGESSGLLSPQKKKRKSVVPRKALKIDFSEMSVQGMRFTKSREGREISDFVDPNGAYSLPNDMNDEGIDSNVALSEPTLTIPAEVPQNSVITEQCTVPAETTPILMKKTQGSVQEIMEVAISDQTLQISAAQVPQNLTKITDGFNKESDIVNETATSGDKINDDVNEAEIKTIDLFAKW